MENEIFTNFTKAAERNGHFKVYNQNNLPERWHANNERRMGPILAVADIEYGFQDLMDEAIKYKELYNVTSKFGCCVLLTIVSLRWSCFREENYTMEIIELLFSVTNTTQYGVHGYDNVEPSMRAIFIANGPIFNKGKVFESINVIDLYSLFCLILDIKCGKTDGFITLYAWNEMFIKQFKNTIRKKNWNVENKWKNNEKFTQK